LEMLHKMQTGEVGGPVFWVPRLHRRIMETDEQAVKSLRMEIEELERRIRDLDRPAKEYLTVFDEIAMAAAEYIDILGLRESAEARIVDIQQESLGLTTQQKQEMMEQADIAYLAYARILAGLDRYADHLAEPFQRMFPTYEDFVQVDPRAYAPFSELLSNLAAVEDQQIKNNQKTEAGRILLEQLGIEWGDSVGKNLAIVTNQYEYWSELLDNVLEGHIDLNYLYEAFGVEGKDPAQAYEAVLEQIQKGKAALGETKVALQKNVELANQWAMLFGMIEDTYKGISTFTPPGRLEFLAPDVGASQIQAMLDRYTELFRGYIDSQEQTFHAFIRDEQGVVQSLLATFEAQPEVWSAMLQELRSIEQNTAARLEAEYNIPSWYQTPTRYWAMKTTGMQEGFGPAQEGMWELWKEFLARHRDDIKDIEVPDIIKDEAVEGIEDLNDALKETAEVAPAFADVIRELFPVTFDIIPSYLEWRDRQKELDETIDDIASEATETANKVSGFTNIFNRISGALSGILPFDLPKIEEDETYFDMLWRTISGIFGDGLSEVDKSSKTTGDSLDKLSGTMLSSSSNINQSLGSTSSALVITSSKVDSFADAIRTLGYVIDQTPSTAPGGGALGPGPGDLIHMQQGGVVPATGPYYLHKQEVVSSVSDIKNTNALLGSSYKVLLMSQSYLSSINIGISGLRQEISLLRQQIGHGGSDGGAGYTEFRRVTNTGYVGVSALGTRRT